MCAKEADEGFGAFGRHRRYLWRYICNRPGYLVIDSNAPEFLGFGGDATGINEVKAVEAKGEFFNLAGQRVAKPVKGLYIANGKKVIIK